MIINLFVLLNFCFTVLPLSDCELKNKSLSLVYLGIKQSSIKLCLVDEWALQVKEKGANVVHIFKHTFDFKN